MGGVAAAGDPSRLGPGAPRNRGAAPGSSVPARPTGPAALTGPAAPTEAVAPGLSGSQARAATPARGARTSLWPREPAAGRQPLSRAAIVAAAMELADAEGLEAVSIRRVAARLNARPMTLYSHIGSKDDLLDHMLEAVAGEGSPDPAALPADWRAALRMIADDTRRSVLRHPWTVSLIGRRIPFGPNALKHLEASLAAVSGLDVDRETKIEILTAVDTFTLGHVIREIAERSAQEEAAATSAAASGAAASGCADTSIASWVASVTDYIHRATRTGEYPHTRAFGPMLPGSTLGSGVLRFERGLDWVLAGIEASLPGPGGASAPAGRPDSVEPASPGPGRGPNGPRDPGPRDPDRRDPDRRDPTGPPGSVAGSTE
jgi:AcrR family transcriptional regulator